ncbi:type VI secretion system tip protein TssI/VgrG [Massilia sp. W12]|uniref:type VI secretion system Vgr family protein n=1 Tax=Massilia sp. W12 TaxID=3126507 RepID=UPI0030CC0586
MNNSATEHIISLLNGGGKRLLKLYFPREDGPDAGLLVNRLVADEGVSRDFCYTVTLLSDDSEIELKDVLGRMVCVELQCEGRTQRYFNGYCFEFERTDVQQNLSVYKMVLRPWLAFFKLRRNHHIFHDMTITEQSKEIFLYSGTASHDFMIKQGDPKRTFSCQYGETDYNYLHRRWEEMGWHYWYEHSLNGHRLIISDNSCTSRPLDGKLKLMLHHDGGATKEDRIHSWEPQRQAVAGKVEYASYDFKNPDPQLAAHKSTHEQGDVFKIEVYAYQGLYGFKEREHGAQMTRRHMEQIESAAKNFEGRGECRTMQAGRYFQLGMAYHTPGNEADMEFFITDVFHVVDNNYLNGSGAHATYDNRFRCLRRRIPWRPQQGFNSEAAPDPGMDTATVVGPDGEEIHTDKYGRIKVQFHWDRIGEFNEKSCAWLRVMTPWAQNQFGIIALPRVGSEVVVQFLQGNPDRPLVLGQVYNERHMPPWALPMNRTQSGILTRSSKGGTPANANALRFEDKKGEEEVWLHAEKNQRIEVEHDESHWVGHDRSKKVDHDETVVIKNNRRENVGNDETININHNRTETVGNNESITVEKDRTIEIKQNERITIGKVQITKAGEHMEFVCGAAKIVLQSDGGIYLHGTHIEIQGSQAINADGGMVFINDGKSKAPPKA